LRAQAGSVQSASSILQSLNGQLYDDLTRAELFITMFYASYNTATGRLSFANAGHNHPMISRSGEESCIELDAEGLILGVRPSVIFEERSVDLQKDDVLLFYTDGLTEATRADGELFGNGRLCTLLGSIKLLPAKEMLDAIYRTIAEFTGSKILQDDVSVVVLKIL
jgi:sigma-B regulation protein RsbU (phosphoserine phosphatase)